MSAPMLAGELIKRQLVAKDRPVADAYAMVRAAMAELVAEGQAQAWPDGYCWSISARTPVDE